MATEKTVKADTENKVDFYEEKVPVFLMKDGGKYKDDLTVTVNGKNYQIRRGQTVMVPRKVALIIERGREQEMRAQQMMESLVNAKEV